jgi:hypothetical protein
MNTHPHDVSGSNPSRFLKQPQNELWGYQTGQAQTLHDH